MPELQALESAVQTAEVKTVAKLRRKVMVIDKPFDLPYYKGI
jgi:hypothetical protein